MTPTDAAAAKVIWNFLRLDQGDPEPCDIAIAMGTTDVGVAQRCAELWHEQRVKQIIFSGYAQKGMDITEAELFANEALRLGVPETAILRERKASNSAENFLFSYELMKKHNLPTERVTIVCKPYMERRAYSIAMAQWPVARARFSFTSQKISFEEYMDINDTQHAVALMLGDLRRIDEYPAKGWQIPQDIPAAVWAAYHTLEQNWKVRDIKA